MKLYFANSLVLDAEYLIRAENEWQARDIADQLDHDNRSWEAECMEDDLPAFKAYYTLGNGKVTELKMDGEAGLVATSPGGPWY